MVPYDILVIGADGLIGCALTKHLRKREKSVLTTTRRKKVESTRLFLDLSKDVSDWHPGALVNTAVICSGISKFDQCERMRDETHRINVESITQITQTLSDMGVIIIYISTSAVFDGETPYRREVDKANPMSDYGRQKLEVEQHIISISDKNVILRFTKVLNDSPSLFTKWIEMLRNKEIITPFNDIFMAPISLRFAIEAITSLIDRNSSGIWHVSGDQDIGYDDIARYIGHRIDADNRLIKPISVSASSLSSGYIPRYSSLNADKFTDEFGIFPPSVFTTIDSALSI